MKKLLVATSALGAAGSAAALEVSLGGSLTSTITYTGDSANAAGATGAWSGPAFSSADVEWSLSGADAGWSYGATMSIAGAMTSMSIGNDSLGTVTMTPNNLKWEGMSVGGFALSASAATNALEAVTVGLSGSLGGMSVAGDITNDTNRAFNLDFGTAVAGASVDIETKGNLSDTSAIGYEVTVGMAAMGIDLGLNFGNGGHDPLVAAGVIGVSAGLGDLSISASLGDGDLFNGMSVSYETDLAAGLGVAATVSTDGTDTDMTIATTLSF